ncbi:MAG: hypothetical protein M0Z82_13820, partial [Actinomycetota bacterium]|nr:hypothetical protein [Actinomycetota bacterium]
MKTDTNAPDLDADDLEPAADLEPDDLEPGTSSQAPRARHLEPGTSSQTTSVGRYGRGGAD